MLIVKIISESEWFTLIHGDVIEASNQLEDNSINLIITSPPYWGLRDYGINGQIGLENTPTEFVNKLLEVFRILKPKLRNDGSLWVNLGDTYSGSGNANGHTKESKNTGRSTLDYGAVQKPPQQSMKIQRKSLVTVPFMFATAMVHQENWILRNVIIWHKPSCMPTNATDRFTVDFEYLFFFTKKPKYYFKQQLEETTGNAKPRRKDGERSPKYSDEMNGFNNRDSFKTNYLPLERNKRSVWSINTSQIEEKHFAVFPRELIRDPIDACCPEKICVNCSKPIIKKYKTKRVNLTSGSGKSGKKPKGKGTIQADTGEYDIRMGPVAEREIRTIKCKCETDFIPGIVLDPFCGSGTVGVESISQGKKFIGFDINYDYLEIAKRRIETESFVPLSHFFGSMDPNENFISDSTANPQKQEVSE